MERCFLRVISALSSSSACCASASVLQRITKSRNAALPIFGIHRLRTACGRYVQIPSGAGDGLRHFPAGSPTHQAESSSSSPVKPRQALRTGGSPPGAPPPASLRRYLGFRGCLPAAALRLAQAGRAYAPKRAFTSLTTRLPGRTGRGQPCPSVHRSGPRLSGDSEPP